MNLPIPLKDFQTICKKIEADMTTFLLEFTPVQDMSVTDMKTIVRFARDLAFRAFDEYFGRDKKSDEKQVQQK